MLYLNNSVSNFSNNSYISTIVVYTLIFGTFISYSPQYYRMYKKKTVKGINEYMLIFGYFSCFFNLIGTINEDNINITNCINNNYINSTNKTDCSTLLISLLQLSSPLICAIIFYVFFCYYVKSTYSKRDYLYELQNNSNIILDTNINYNNEVNKYLKDVKKRYFLSILISLLIVIASLIIILIASIKVNNIFGIILNVLSALFSIFMWVPQLITTFKLKSNYSLSILALFIHALGCFLTTFYQTLVAHQQFYVVLCYIIGFVFEISICIIVLYNRCKYKNNYQNNNLNNINNNCINSDYINSNYIDNVNVNNSFYHKKRVKFSNKFDKNYNNNIN